MSEHFERDRTFLAVLFLGYSAFLVLIIAAAAVWFWYWF
jgi:hypothetical protein